VPHGGLLLTAGVDVQKDRLVVEVVAWGREKESWSIMYGMLPGDTADLGPKGCWALLDALLARTYAHGSGVEMSITKMAVDSGYNTSIVYTWCRRHPNLAIPIKGHGGSGALIGAPTSVEINLRGKPVIRGVKVWPVIGGVAKSELYGHLRLEKPDGWVEGQAMPPGWCHFPEYDEEYFRQLTAEHLVTHPNNKGYLVTDWEQIPGRENHVLDARVYARAAAALAQMDRFAETDWAALERQVVGRVH
jgi:phage terminase large subunit GpA-like protein